MAIKISRCDGVGEVLTAAVLEMQANQVAEALEQAVKQANLDVKIITAAMNVNDPRFQKIVELFEDVLRKNSVLNSFPEEAQKKGLLKWLKANAPQYLRGLDSSTLQNIFDTLKGKLVYKTPEQEPVVPKQQYHVPAGREGQDMMDWHREPAGMMGPRGIQ